MNHYIKFSDTQNGLWHPVLGPFPEVNIIGDIIWDIVQAQPIAYLMHDTKRWFINNPYVPEGLSPEITYDSVQIYGMTPKEEEEDEPV